MPKKSPSSSETKSRILGPGLIVAAAFVGPGTVITASKAGSQFNLGLLWVVFIAVIAAIVLQEMAARLGTLTSMGLGELLRRQFTQRVKFGLLAFLIVAAIGFGNAAYQTGNLVGAAVGLRLLVDVPILPLSVLLAAVAAALLWWGSYRVIERVLIAAVAVMGLAFVAAAIAGLRSGNLQWSTLTPSLPSGSIAVTMALVGTTIVPYNLFLHASAASERWASIRPRGNGLRSARIDTVIGIIAGGIVTAAIVIAAAAALPGQEISTAGEAAAALESVVGTKFAKLLLSLGIAAAGLSSAITAPLAAALAISGLFGWSREKYPQRFRAIWGTVLLCGLLAAVTTGKSPAETILLAQVANVIVLPVIAAVVLLACNAPILGQYKNKLWQNIVAGLVIVVVAIMAGLRIWL